MLYDGTEPVISVRFENNVPTTIASCLPSIQCNSFILKTHLEEYGSDFIRNLKNCLKHMISRYR